MIQWTPKIKTGVMGDINVQLGNIPIGESYKKIRAFVRGVSENQGKILVDGNVYDSEGWFIVVKAEDHVRPGMTILDQ